MLADIAQVIICMATNLTQRSQSTNELLFSSSFFFFFGDDT